MTSLLRLPPLYFQDKGRSLTASTAADLLELPPEVLHKCLSEFATFGSLAKLACVQSAWKNVMYDAAAASPASLWTLACALLEGTDDMLLNNAQAMKLLHQLVAMVVDIDLVTQAPIYNVDDIDTKNDIEFAAKAMKKLAYLYLEQEPPGNAATGLAWLNCAFEAGNDVGAAHDMAVIYEYGRHSVPTDVVAAAVYFEKAAVAGHVEAMAEIALCYELGCGVEANDETALDWYIKAATAGHTTAKFSVGEAFEEARGVPRSDEEACLWYYKAAVEGDEDSRKALKRLEGIARIVVPGARALLDA